MPHVVRLPPLIRESGDLTTDRTAKKERRSQMSHHNQNSFEFSARQHRRQSVLATSDTRADSKPIDCVLVYNDTIENFESQYHRQKAAESRQRFEEYLKKKQRLVLEHCVCN